MPSYRPGIGPRRITIALLVLAMMFAAADCCSAAEAAPRLYVVENIANVEGVVKTRNLVRLSLDQNNAVVKETLLSKDQEFFGHFGGHRIALNRFVVTRHGGVIDIDSRKVVHEEQGGELLGIENDKVIFRVNNSRRKSGIFVYDLTRQELSELQTPSHWQLPGKISPNKTMSVRQEGDSIIWLHRLNKAAVELGRDFHVQYSNYASIFHANSECISWVDDKRILAVKSNKKLAIVNVDGTSMGYIDVEAAPAEVLSPPDIQRDKDENLIYSCGGMDFLIDVTHRKAEPLKRHSLGYGFEASVSEDSKRRSTVFLEGRAIGAWVLNHYDAASAPGVLAFPTVEPSADANLGETTGVALWDVRIRDWRLNKMWVNDVIGWSK